MSDPFLLAHEVARNFYDISGKISPISIRDQMMRGVMLVERALDAGKIGARAQAELEEEVPNTEFWELLIIGAGAAGATAAIHAAENGVRTLLIDRANAPFLLQRRCGSRWLDPTQYDWPLQHWPKRRYPWDKPDMPMPWVAARSNSVAIGWWNTLRSAYTTLNELALECNVEVDAKSINIGASISLALDRVKLKNDKVIGRKPFKQGQFSFKMVIVCIGFGLERSTVGDYTGYRFWQTDPFEQKDLGLKNTSPSVLISGAGDGSLQDFLRVVTKHKSAEEIYNKIWSSIPSKFWLLLLDAEVTIQGEEDQAQRAYSWGEDSNPAQSPHLQIVKGNYDHSVLFALHQAHSDSINTLLSDQSVESAIYGALDTIVRDPLPSVHFVHSCTHFGRCYPLNRFLAILLLKYLKERGHSSVSELPNTRIESVSGINHPCKNPNKTDPADPDADRDPAWCHGREHEVHFTTNAKCYGKPGHVQPMKATTAYNVLIIRHGPKTPSLFYGLPIAAPRQILPYHIPEKTIP